MKFFFCIFLVIIIAYTSFVLSPQLFLSLWGFLFFISLLCILILSLFRNRKILFFDTRRALLLCFIVFSFVFLFRGYIALRLPSLENQESLSVYVHQVIRHTKQKIFLFETLDTHHRGIGRVYFHQNQICSPKISNEETSRNSFEGKILEIIPKKNQIQLHLAQGYLRIYAVWYKNKKNPFPTLQEGESIRVFTKPNQVFQPVKPVKGFSTLYKKGFHYKGTLGKIEKIQTDVPVFTQECYLSTQDPMPEIQEGVSLVLHSKKKEGKTFEALAPWGKYRYFFAKNIRYVGTVDHTTPLPFAPKHTWIQKGKHHLSLLIEHSPFSSFYQKILWNENHPSPFLEKIRKNNLIHFLVISGFHMILLSQWLQFAFLLPFVLWALFRAPRRSTEGKTLWKYIRFQKSFQWDGWIILNFLILLAYLVFLDFPQSASRAVFALLAPFLLRKMHLSVSALQRQIFALPLLWILFPEWITYPLSLLFSYCAICGILFGQYLLDYPPTRMMKFFSHSRHRFWGHPVIQAIKSQIWTSFSVSLWILPLSLYLFHTFSFVGMILSPLWYLLFSLIIFFTFLSALVSFLWLPLGQSILSVSDLLLSGLQFLLEKVSSWFPFSIYQKEAIPLSIVLLVYSGLFLSLWILDKKDFLQSWKKDSFDSTV